MSKIYVHNIRCLEPFLLTLWPLWNFEVFGTELAALAETLSYSFYAWLVDTQISSVSVGLSKALTIWLNKGIKNIIWYEENQRENDVVYYQSTGLEPLSRWSHMSEIFVSALQTNWNNKKTKLYDMYRYFILNVTQSHHSAPLQCRA